MAEFCKNAHDAQIINSKKHFSLAVLAFVISLKGSRGESWACQNVILLVLKARAALLWVIVWCSPGGWGEVLFML